MISNSPVPSACEESKGSGGPPGGAAAVAAGTAELCATYNHLES
jgi:hypothetical protein